MILQIIKSNGITASRLVFEITETAAMANINGYSFPGGGFARELRRR